MMWYPAKRKTQAVAEGDRQMQNQALPPLNFAFLYVSVTMSNKALPASYPCVIESKSVAVLTAAMFHLLVYPQPRHFQSSSLAVHNARAMLALVLLLKSLLK